MAKCSETPSVWVEVQVEGMCDGHKKLLENLVDHYTRQAFRVFDRMTGMEVASVWDEKRKMLELPEAKGTH